MFWATQSMHHLACALWYYCSTEHCCLTLAVVWSSVYAPALDWHGAYASGVRHCEHFLFILQTMENWKLLDHVGVGADECWTSVIFFCNRKGHWARMLKTMTLKLILYLWHVKMSAIKRARNAEKRHRLFFVGLLCCDPELPHAYLSTHLYIFGMK